MPERLSFQLYSARNHASLGDTFETLAKIGYHEVEGYDAIFAEIKNTRMMMDANGLTMPTTHCSLDLLEVDKSSVMNIVNSLGIRHIYCPYIVPEQRPNDGAGWSALGRRLAAIAQNYSAEGITFGWHNHDFEFTALADGKTPHEHMFAAASNLEWEMDIAWVVRAGADPIDLIKKYAANITAVHLKDIAPNGANAHEDGWADVGHGTIDWPPIMAALNNTRVRHFVVEHDKPSDIIRFATRAFCAASHF